MEIRGSHILLGLKLTKMQNKNNGKIITALEDKAVLLAAMIKQPSLIETINEDKKVDDITLNKLYKAGFKIGPLEKLKIPDSRALVNASSSTSFEANLSLRTPIAPDTFSQYTKVAANLTIKQV